jgi:hypothetical protein
VHEQTQHHQANVESYLARAYMSSSLSLDIDDAQQPQHPSVTWHWVHDESHGTTHSPEEPGIGQGALEDIRESWHTGDLELHDQTRDRLQQAIDDEERGWADDVFSPWVDHQEPLQIPDDEEEHSRVEAGA